MGVVVVRCWRHPHRHVRLGVADYLFQDCVQTSLFVTNIIPWCTALLRHRAVFAKSIIENAIHSPSNKQSADEEIHALFGDVTFHWDGTFIPHMHGMHAAFMPCVRRMQPFHLKRINHIVYLFWYSAHFFV